MNTQNTAAGTPGPGPTQNNTNTQNITINNHGQQDETGYTMPTWIYGNPNLDYSGQPASGGVSLATMQGLSAAGGDSGPMPISGMNGESAVSAPPVSSGTAQAQRMRNPLSMSATHTPSSSEEAYQASLRSLLDRNVGYFVAITFQLGGQSVTWQGILHTVGSDYIVLYQPDYERYVSCDIYSIKFVQFYNVKGVPYCAASQSWQGHQSY